MKILHFEEAADEPMDFVKVGRKRAEEINKIYGEAAAGAIQFNETPSEAEYFATVPLRNEKEAFDLMGCCRMLGIGGW